jgi:hypothetical protein
MHKDVEEKSLAELAPSYEVAFVYLVHMLEARFASLNPFMQHMFLKLHDIEDPEKKSFILETLRIEFRDVAIEARKVFKKFNKLGSPVEVVGIPNEDFRVPIPCKLVGIHDALEKNFSWICPDFFLMKVVYQSMITRDSQKLIWTQFNSLLKRILRFILMPLSILLNSHFLRLAQRRYRKALLGDNPMFLISVLFLLFESWKLLLL